MPDQIPTGTVYIYGEPINMLTNDGVNKVVTEINDAYDRHHCDDLQSLAYSLFIALIVALPQEQD